MVSYSLRSLTLQAQAQASPSLLYSPSSDPSCLAKVFSHRKNYPSMCMIPINSLQELLRSPLPCGHSPSRPRLKHLLLCYTVPQVIHLAFPRFSHTERILETLSSLTVEASLRLVLSRCPSGLCYLNTTYSR
jgi:hypothetical protein